MNQNKLIRSVGQGLACGVGIAAGAYAATAGAAWLWYGRAQPATGDDEDPWLDRFMPTYEIAERHHAHVKAPADIALAAACEVDFEQSAIIRAIFKGRELMLGSRADDSARPRGLVAMTRSIGWGVLADVPGREIVLGAVTQPWKADVVFRALPSDEFAAFADPDYVKIVWNLRADAEDAGASVVRTETRVIATDRSAREKFRRYWSLFSPGILLIRRVALGLVKAEAERRARAGRLGSADRFDLVSSGDLDAQC